MNAAALLLPLLVVAPLLAFAWIGMASLRERAPSERTVVRITRLGSIVTIVTAAVAIALTLRSPKHVLVFSLGRWVETPERVASLVLDAKSAPLLAIVALLTGVVGHFSAPYLHRERGHARFFTLFNLFVAGMTLLSLAGALDLFYAGWELVGLTSTLLIAFFHERVAPVENALRAFVTYRVCDVGLLLAVLLQVGGGAGAGPRDAFAVGGSHATLVAVLLLLAAMGKSAQFPFGGWLPRAMEGPTPSSAIFYGALSVHAGVYLLVRAEPWMGQIAGVRVATVAVGLVSAALATLTSRTQTDVKGILASATITQVGVMFVEIGLGFPTLALAHMVGHASLRTWQLLRAPSVLRDRHDLHAALGGALPRRGGHFERLVPLALQRRLFDFALHGFFLDEIVDATIVRGVQSVARAALSLESSWLALFGRAPRSELTSGASEGADSEAKR